MEFLIKKVAFEFKLTEWKSFNRKAWRGWKTLCIRLGEKSLGWEQRAFEQSSKNCVRTRCHLCTGSCRRKATGMNVLFCGVCSTPGSIHYTEPSPVLLLAHHKLQALVDQGWTQDLLLWGLLLLFESTGFPRWQGNQKFVLRFWVRISLEHLCQSGKVFLCVLLPLGLLPSMACPPLSGAMVHS